MSTVFIEKNNPEISSTLIGNVQAVEDSRKQIINEINSSFKPYDFSKLTDNIEYTNPNKAQYVNQILNFEKLIPTDTNLVDLPQAIQDKIIPWQPVMQIARSGRGNGTFNKAGGTATIITLYNKNNTVQEFVPTNDINLDNVDGFIYNTTLSTTPGLCDFFTANDVKNDENGAPLCYWGKYLDGTNITSTTYTMWKNKIPNNPLIQRFSNKTYKPGKLFYKANTNPSDGSLLYYQLTFPFDCYVCMTISTQTNWNDVEHTQDPVAFMITDNKYDVIVARSSNDDGTGNNNINGPNRGFSTIYWHGYVKKGWKLYYAEQDQGGSYEKVGHCCVIFRVGNNDALIHNNGYTVSPILSMYRTANGQQHTSVENGTSINVVMHNNEVSSNYIISAETWLGPDNSSDNYDIKHILPDTPLFNKYSVAGSKGGTLFLSSNTNAYALHSAIKVKEDGYLAVSLGGSKYKNAEDYGNRTDSGETFALVICKPNSNEIRIAKTSCDDGNGNNINSTFKTSVQFTGKVYKDEKIYFANLDNAMGDNPASRWHCSVGMSLTLYKLIKSNDKILEDLYNNTSIKQISKNYSDAVNTISDENYNVIKNAFNANIANLAKTNGCIIEQLTENSIAVITMYISDYANSNYSCCYIRTDDKNNILECNRFVYNGTANSSTYQGGLTKVLTCNRGDKVFVSTLTASFVRFVSLTICPIEY